LVHTVLEQAAERQRASVLSDLPLRCVACSRSALRDF
jgi:hypothetical protein